MLRHQKGKDLTYFFVRTLICAREVQSFRVTGALFHSFVASLKHVFWERAHFPVSMSLPEILALVFVLSKPTSCLGIWIGQSLMFRDFQISMIVFMCSVVLILIRAMILTQLFAVVVFCSTVLQSLSLKSASLLILQSVSVRKSISRFS